MPTPPITTSGPVWIPTAAAPVVAQTLPAPPPDFGGKDTFLPEDQEMEAFKQELGLMRQAALQRGKGGGLMAGYRAEGGGSFTAQTSGRGRLAWGGASADAQGQAGIRAGAQGRSEAALEFGPGGLKGQSSHSGKVAVEAFAKGQASLKGPGGVGLDAEGQIEHFTGADGNLTTFANVKPGAIELKARGKGRIGTETSTSGSFKTTGLPLGLTAEGKGEASVFAGAKAEGEGSFKLDKRGVDAEFNSDLMLGMEAKAKGSGKLSGLPFGSSLDTEVEGKYFNGARHKTGGFENPAVPGVEGKPGQLKVDANGRDLIIDGFGKGFVGEEVEAKLTQQLTTPIGSLKNETKVRAANGIGGDGGLQLRSTRDELTLGGGFSFEVGQSVSAENSTTVATANGSGVTSTKVVGAGGESMDIRAGASRNNETGKTSVGFKVVVPVPELKLDLGTGMNVTVDDKDVRAVGNFVVPGGGDAAVGALKAAPAVVSEARETVVTVVQKPVEVGQAVKQNGVNDIVEGQRKGGLDGFVQQTNGVAGVVIGKGIEDTGNFIKGTGDFITGIFGGKPR